MADGGGRGVGEGGSGRWRDRRCRLVRAGVFDEDFGGLADELLAIRKALLERELFQCIHSVGDGLMVDELALPAGGGRALTGGEGEAMGVEEANLLDQIEGLSEEIVGFAGKTDDDVGGESGAVEEVAKTAYRLEVIGASVLAVHLAEDGVRTALEREVEVGHDLPVGGKGAKEFGSDIAGLKTGEPEALEAGDLGAEGIDEGREGFRGVELAMSKCRIIAISA